MYMVVNFPGGTVAGATDVLGATSLGKVFWFASASTQAGENDYLTLQNPSQTAANVTITYHTLSGAINRTLKKADANPVKASTPISEKSV